MDFFLHATVLSFLLNDTLLSPARGLLETAGLVGVVAMRAFLVAVMLLISDFFSILMILISSAEFFSLDILTAGVFLRPACLPLTNARAMPNRTAPITT